MEISRENIFGLLGSGSRKYHSCVLMTFTFDFSFFEMQAMRALKGAGVRNVLVLLDEGIMNELTAHPTGFEFSRNTGYSLHPIRAQGVFHPKLILCAGPKEGLIAIGSGNLTAAGHSSNDELWSVFHVKDTDTPNALLFRQVWEYVKQISRDIQGNAAEKLRWFEQYSPWMGKITETAIGDPISFKNEQVFLVPIQEGSDGIGILSQKLGGEEIQAIQILSPFYDSDGALLHHLHKSFPKASLQVVLDTDRGSLPLDFDRSEKVSFYDWKKCFQQKDNQVSRLHAKLLVFRSASGAEFFLIGSSNATVPAIGTKERPAANKELGLFIKQKGAPILQKLGIQLIEEGKVDLSKLERKDLPNVFDKARQERHPLQIQTAELDGDEIIIHTRGDYENPVQLIVYDRDQKELASIKEAAFTPKFRAHIPNSASNKSPVFYASWNTPDGELLSNRQFVQDTAIHHKSNPDPKIEQLESLLDEISGGQYEKMAELFQYVTFGHEDDNPKSGNKSGGTIPLKDKKGEPAAEFKVARSYEEFTSVSQEALLKQKGLLTSANLRVAEMLAAIRKKQLDIQSEREIRSDEQIDNLDKYGGETDEIVQATTKKRTLDDCQKEKRAVQTYLKRYFKHLSNKFEEYNEQTKKKIKVLPRTPLTLTEYSNFLISAHLALHYTQLSLPVDPKQQYRQESYLSANGSKHYDGLKGYAIEILPAFLLLQQQGDVAYDFEGTEKRKLNFKKEAFFYAVFFTCNALWNKSERMLKELLQYNSTVQILREEAFRADALLKDLQTWVHEKKKEGVFISSLFQANFEEYTQEVFPKVAAESSRLYRQKNHFTPASDLKAGSFIYKNEYGICQVNNIQNGYSKDQKKVTLTHPGFSQINGNGNFNHSLELKSSILLKL